MIRRTWQLKRAIKREVRSISRETCGNFLCEAGKRVSCATKNVFFSCTCYSGGVVGCGEDAGPVAKKSPQNVLRDDIKKF